MLPVTEFTMGYSGKKKKKVLSKTVSWCFMTSPKSDLRWSIQYRANGLLGASWMVFWVPKELQARDPQEWMCMYLCVRVCGHKYMHEWNSTSFPWIKASINIWYQALPDYNCKCSLKTFVSLSFLFCPNTALNSC